MKVSVSGKQFVFPRSCACCGGYPLASLAITGSERNKKARTKGWVWEIPYCVGCRRHIRTSELIILVGFLLGATLVLGAVITLLLTRLVLLALVLFLASGVLVGALCWGGWRLEKNRRPKNCQGMTRSVRYLGSTGSCHSFDIRSSWYAAEFVRANHLKLVNVSPRVASILRGTSFGADQVPRRLIRSR